MILPYGNDQTARRIPWMTAGVMLLCLLLEIWAASEPLQRMELVMRWGYLPSHGIDFRLLTCSFLHGDWLHLAGNLLFLYVVGLSVENRWGRLGFVVLWITGAVASSLAFGLLHSGTDIYLIGASGAIAAVMGVFLVCFHSARIQCWYFLAFRMGTFAVPAYAALPLWFGGQLFWMWFESKGMGGVAYSAHVGGFAFGALGALALRYTGLEQKLLVSRVADPDELVAETDPGLDRLMVTDIGSGLEAIRKILAKDPANFEAHDALLKHAHKTRDQSEIAAQAEYVFPVLHTRGEDRTLLQRYQIIRYDLPTTVLGPRALHALARSADRANQAELAINATQLLITHHTRNPITPGAIWQMVSLQERCGRADLARKTLQLLVTHYPNDPITTRAQARLYEHSLPMA